MVEETGGDQKPATVPQQPSKQVQESTEAAAATPIKPVNSYLLPNSRIIWTLFFTRSYSSLSALAEKTPYLQLRLPMGRAVLD